MPSKISFFGNANIYQINGSKEPEEKDAGWGTWIKNQKRLIPPLKFSNA
ncbi:MAG: hypothetical protein RJA52_1537 [Bacteroidota bacterium]